MRRAPYDGCILTNSFNRHTNFSGTVVYIYFNVIQAFYGRFEKNYGSALACDAPRLL